MDPGVAAGWSDFFVAQAGAAAALAGLLFVAVSINLTKILEFPQLPVRALEALTALLSVLFASSFGLIPGQSASAFGAELLGVGAATWLIQTMALARTHRASRAYSGYVVRVLVNQLPPLPFLIAGILLLAGSGSAIFWTVPAILLSIAAGVFDAWVLLVEIQR